MLGLMAAGLALRVRWWSGYGLGDDIIFRHGINHLLTNHNISVDNQAYRCTWWLPTALSARLLGLSEVSLVLPILIASVLGIWVVYLLGKQLWGRPGGVIAGRCWSPPLDSLVDDDRERIVVSLMAGLPCLRAARPGPRRSGREAAVLDRAGSASARGVLNTRWCCSCRSPC